MPLKNIRVVVALADDDAVIIGNASLPEGELIAFSAILADSPTGETPVGFASGLGKPVDEVPTLAGLELLEGTESRGWLWVAGGGYMTCLTSLDALKAVIWNRDISGYHPMHRLPIADGSTVRVVREDAGAFAATTWLILNFWLDCADVALTEAENGFT